MNMSDVRDLERELQIVLRTATPRPQRHLATRMAASAVSHRQRAPNSLGLSGFGMLRAVGVIVAGVAAGLVVAVALGGLGSDGLGAPSHAYRSPPLEACGQSDPVHTGSCVAFSTGLPAADLSLGGWTYRCPDGSCWQEGTDVLPVLLVNLGDAYVGPTDRELGESGVPLRVDYEANSPVAWAASDGSQGQATKVYVDLTPLAEGRGGAFVTLDGEHAFMAPPELAERLLRAYFTPVP